MKKFLLSCAAALTAVGLFAQNAPTLYGVKIYCEEGCSSGLYKLEAKEGAQPELYWADGDMMGTGGAVYAEGTLYVLTYMDFGFMTLWSYLICDPEAKTYDYLLPETLTLADVGAASTYDPASGNIYTICQAKSDASAFNLCIQDPATGAKTPVTSIDYLPAMAADGKGTIFGIDTKGNLVTVNRFTGETTVVGSTGVVPSANNTAVIDYSTGVMYWNAYTDDGSFLYTVDTATATATMLSKFDTKIQLDGLFLIQSAVSSAAPRQPADVALHFEGGSLSGTVSFTAPELDTEGTALTGKVGYTVATGGAELASGSAEPGEQVSAPIAVEAAGNYQISVQATTDGGSSTPVNVSAWIGHDTPKPVTDCVLTLNGMEATVSWTLPETGINEGYVDPAKVKYMVIRGPYSSTVAEAHTSTTFTETLDFDSMEPLMYGVVAYVDQPGADSKVVVSNTEIVGEYVGVPFVQDLTDPFRHLIFSIHDSNADRCTWEYNLDKTALTVKWAIDEYSDDWLISPPVMLEQGKTYSAAMTLRSEGRWDRNIEDYVDIYSGAVGFSLGTSPTPESMTTQLRAPENVESKDFHELSTPVFTVPETGLYHIGAHHCGERSIYQTLFSRFAVTEAEPDGIADTPAPVSELKTAIESGRLTVFNPAGLHISVTSAAGVQVADDSARQFSVQLHPGVYIVAAPGTKPLKVMVP